MGGGGVTSQYTKGWCVGEVCRGDLSVNVVIILHHLVSRSASKAEKGGGGVSEEIQPLESSWADMRLLPFR